MKAMFRKMHKAKLLVCIAVLLTIVALGYWLASERYKTSNDNLDLDKNQKAFRDSRNRLKSIERDKFNREIVRIDDNEQRRKGKTHAEKLNLIHGVHAKIISEGLNGWRHAQELKEQKLKDQKLKEQKLKEMHRLPYSNDNGPVVENKAIDSPDALVGDGHFMYQRGNKLPTSQQQPTKSTSFYQKHFGIEKKKNYHEAKAKNTGKFDFFGRPIVRFDENGQPIISREEELNPKYRFYEKSGKKKKINTNVISSNFLSGSNIHGNAINQILKGKADLQNTEKDKYIDDKGNVWIKQSRPAEKHLTVNSEENYVYKEKLNHFVSRSIDELHKGTYTVIQDGKTMIVDGHNLNTLSYKEFGDVNSYIFETSRFPKSKRLMPNVGNGHIGTVVGSYSIFMNGVYNGRYGKSHRARIQSYIAINITYIHPQRPIRKLYSLNVAQGVFTETTQAEGFVIEQRTYAHRHYNKLMIHEIDILNVKKEDFVITLNVNDGHPSHDITFQGDTKPSWHLKNALYKFGSIHNTEIPDIARTKVHLIYDQVPHDLNIYKNMTRTKWVFMTSITHDENDCIKMYRQGQELLNNNDVLLKQHVLAWYDLWGSGHVTLDGNLHLSQAIYSSYYNILSALPTVEDEKWPYIGLSPTGLAYGDTEKDYMGHVFWDQETWMFPNVLLQYPDIAKILINGRLRKLLAAKKNARKNKNDGAQFPWESAFTGVEVTPEDKYGIFEIHITGDISFAFRQYIFATKDTELLMSEAGSSILTDIATFWERRCYLNQTTKMREILDVMPPDEHHNRVNNSAYTNMVARISLQNPLLLTQATGIENLNRRHLEAWYSFGERMYIPFNQKEQYHPEFDGYKIGTQVKQGDVILLGYPLMYKMSEIVRLNDLILYEKVVEPDGPAMTWSMFAIGWLEMKNFEKGWQTFKRQFLNIQEPFKVWTETSTGGGAANFITGAGGFLQALTFGYGGIRIMKDRLDFDPVLPPKVNHMNITGVKYLGASFNFIIKKDTVEILLRSVTPKTPSFMVKVYATAVIKYPHINEPVVIGKQKATLMQIVDRDSVKDKAHSSDS